MFFHCFGLKILTPCVPCHSVSKKEKRTETGQEVCIGDHEAQSRVPTFDEDQKNGFLRMIITYLQVLDKRRIEYKMSSFVGKIVLKNTALNYSLNKTSFFPLKMNLTTQRLSS
jgi:hypothetical protein